MRALGDIIDIGTCVAPVDLNTADAFTGKRISMAGASALTFVFFGGAGGAENLTLDFQQHTAYTSGVSADLDAAAVSTSRGLTEYFIKAEALLDNDESWVRVTQSVASELTVVGATYGAMQKIVVAHIDATQLGTDYTHVSVDGTLAASSTSQLVGGLYILHGLRYRRRPDKLGNLLNPGAVNV